MSARYQHGTTRTLRTTGYRGGVAVHPYTDQEPRAAGGITLTVECCACGARRSENHNQGWVEVGTWGPSRETRRQHAATLRRRAESAIRSIEEVRTAAPDGSPLVLSVDRDGMICVLGRHWDHDMPAIMAATTREWRETAVRARRLALEAAEAEAEVAS